MASLTALRDALKATISATIPSLHVYDTVPDTVVFPAVLVTPRSADFDVAMGRGLDTWEMELTVLVQYGDPQSAQEQLDGYITGAGGNAIRQAIFNARTLSLAGTDAHVTGMTDYSARVEIAGTETIGAKLICMIHTVGES